MGSAELLLRASERLLRIPHSTLRTVIAQIPRSLVHCPAPTPGRFPAVPATTRRRIAAPRPSFLHPSRGGCWHSRLARRATTYSRGAPAPPGGGSPLPWPRRGPAPPGPPPPGRPPRASGGERRTAATRQSRAPPPAR